MIDDQHVETIDLVSLDPPRALAPQRPWYDPRLAVDWLIDNRWLTLFVLVPSLLSGVYFGLVAVDRYEAEARFVVRRTSTSSANPLSKLMESSGSVRSSEDAHIVHAYIRSRDVVQQLKLKAALIDRLGRQEAEGDLLWVYPGPLRRQSDEGLWRHFQRFIDIDLDKSTGITTLKVQGFRPDDARDIAEALLGQSETLINTMSERAHREALRSAEFENGRSRDLAQAALRNITEFRRRHELIDPGRTTAAALETITRLSVEIARTKAELAEILQASPNSPQVASLRLRITAFEEQIQKERTALAGTDTSLAPLIAEYERLVLEREFAERTFAAAQMSLNGARMEAERQRLFLERISSPGLSDYPKFPRRLLNTFLTFATLMLLYVIGHKLQTDTRSHAGR